MFKMFKKNLQHIFVRFPTLLKNRVYNRFLVVVKNKAKENKMNIDIEIEQELGIFCENVKRLRQREGLSKKEKKHFFAYIIVQLTFLYRPEVMTRDRCRAVL